MEIADLSLPATNKFASEYYYGTEEIKSFFHYNYQDGAHYSERLNELSERIFMREELTDHIASFMKPFPTSSKVKESLEKLKQSNSVVVIGGQQAGILTGPLYSIHKVISIIAFAKQKEEELGVPVVPIFWIAGEDHDYAEVNHIYLENDRKLEKWVYPNKIMDKRMVTDCPLNKELCQTWIQEVIATFGETDHTKELIAFSKRAIDVSETFVDFFAYIVMELFKEFGLLLVDSGNRELRQLEKKILAEQINKAEQITSAVWRQQAELDKHGYSKTIDMSKNAANLFYYDEEHFERILLEFDSEQNLFTGKNGSLSFSMDEILALADKHPERLSNNVVTRPLMQENLFPTLAFIAGPGEIAYWAELKQAFEEFGMKMPPIIPRINITLVERDIAADLAQMQLDFEHVLKNGLTEEVDTFMESVKDPNLVHLFTETKNLFTENYGKIMQHAEKDYRGLIPLMQKNEKLLLEQIMFMEGKFEEALKLKYDVTMRKYAQIENSLRPNGGPQERTLNIFYFLNKYGLNFVEQLTNLPFEFDGKHKIVRI